MFEAAELRSAGRVRDQTGSAGRTPGGSRNDASPSAKILGVNQAAVSKCGGADMYVTTLQDFVKAMGEELKIIAQFPDGAVEIRRFEESERG